MYNQIFRLWNFKKWSCPKTVWNVTNLEHCTLVMPYNPWYYALFITNHHSNFNLTGLNFLLTGYFFLCWDCLPERYRVFFPHPSSFHRLHLDLCRIAVPKGNAGLFYMIQACAAPRACIQRHHLTFFTKTQVQQTQQMAFHHLTCLLYTSPSPRD